MEMAQSASSGVALVWRSSLPVCGENFQYLNMDGSRYSGQVEDDLPGFDCDIEFEAYLEGWAASWRGGPHKDMQGHPVRGGENVRRTEVRRAGGRYHSDLRQCVRSFVEGFE